MADIKSSGYKAAESTVLSTELNALADEGYCALSAAIDNTTDLYLLMDVEVALANYTAGTVGDESVLVYVVPSLDGTNYPDWTAGVADAQENENYKVAYVAIEQGAGTKRAVARNLQVPPGQFRVAVRQRTNAALAGAGNTVKVRYHQYQVV